MQQILTPLWVSIIRAQLYSTVKLPFRIRFDLCLNLLANEWEVLVKEQLQNLFKLKLNVVLGGYSLRKIVLFSVKELLDLPTNPGFV